MSETTIRQPSGIPVGGQFANRGYKDADVQLNRPTGAHRTGLTGQEVLASTVNGTVITYNRAPGVQVDVDVSAYTDSIPDEHRATRVVLNKSGKVSVSFAEWDESGGVHKFPEGCGFREFGSESDRNAFVREHTSVGIPASHIFIVEHHSHGASRFAVLGNPGIARGPSDRWDAKPSCVLIVRPDIANPAEAADAMIAEYTAYHQGETYGIRTLTLDASGEELDNRSVWGFIGDDEVDRVIRAGSF